MKTTILFKPIIPPRSFWTALVCLLTGLFTVQPASAVTLNPSVDSRSTPSAGPIGSNTQDMTVGPVGATTYYRSYMTFDLSTLTTNDTASTATLKLFGNATSEGNTSVLPQVFTLFQVSSDWNGTVAPGPEGTALATVNITPALGNDAQNIEFSGANLVNAFNNAIGGTLYLGIKSDKEGVTNRSFCNFQSIEDPNKPTLSTINTNLPTISVSVTDASASEPGADTATFTLDRGSATNNALTVFYTFGGTATQGSDYTESGSGSVTFATGASTANVVSTAVNDAVAERLETVILTLTSDATYNIGSSGTGTATLSDDNDDNNDVLVRYIFTDPNSTGSTFSLAAQVYSTNVSATAIAAAAGIGVGSSSTAVSPPNAGYINSTVTTSNQTDAIANDDYFSFTLTPTIGNSLTLTNLELSARYVVT
ncbi:MAG: DNRLRE domain-containing protein, partial [Verrucomicrobiota bacterium]